MAPDIAGSGGPPWYNSARVGSGPSLRLNSSDRSMAVGMRCQRSPNLLGRDLQGFPPLFLKSEAFQTGSNLLESYQFFTEFVEVALPNQVQGEHSQDLSTLLRAFVNMRRRDRRPCYRVHS